MKFSSLLLQNKFIQADGAFVVSLFSCKMSALHHLRTWHDVNQAGNTKAWPLLRRLYDWFNDPDQNPYQPYLSVTMVTTLMCRISPRVLRVSHQLNRTNP
jgi:hypothetical protein